MTDSRIVAVGLLSRRDLEVLGTGFTRAFPVKDLAGFEDLLAKLDHVSPVQPYSKQQRR